ncbi:MAG: zinc ribbon domain-containing protein [Chloroflexi bacterium]|nr:zinc ribbon domain-containing protein [Chloroflexota bacterium]
MPLYDYDCAACGRRFEVIHGVHTDPPEACPLCGGGPVKKAITAASVHYKGSGWAKKERRAAIKTSSSSGGSDDSSSDAGPSTSESGASSESDSSTSKSDSSSEPGSSGPKPAPATSGDPPTGTPKASKPGTSKTPARTSD